MERGQRGPIVRRFASLLTACGTATIVACGSGDDSAPQNMNRVGADGDVGLPSDGGAGGDATVADEATETSADGPLVYGDAATNPILSRISLAADFGCAIRSNGNMSCWGRPNYDGGQTVAPPGHFWHVAVHHAVGYAVDDVNDPNFWGTPDTGAEVVPPIAKFSFLALATSYGCGVEVGGILRCWGAMKTPPKGTFQQIAASRYDACALSDAGTVSCWGYFPSWIPPTGTFTFIAAGEFHGCGVQTDGSVACWGLGSPTQLPDAGANDWGQGRPPTGRFIRVAAGEYHTCGIRDTGDVACWGAGTKVGDCQASLDECGMSVPPQGKFIDIAAGYTNSCGITADGPIVCWGSNTGDRSTPPTDFQ
jgi:hypothetical protein